MLERPGLYQPFHRPFAFFLEPPAGAEPQGFKDDVSVLSCKSGPRQGVLCELEQFTNLQQSPPPSQPPTPAAAKAGVGGLDRLLDSHEIIWFRTVGQLGIGHAHYGVWKPSHAYKKMYLKIQVSEIVASLKLDMFMER